MPIRVNLPDGRVVNFPDGMSPDQISAEVTKLAPPTPPEPKAERTWGDTFADALPATGGLLGGLMGTPLGPAGAIGGAALGGALGSGARLMTRSTQGKPEPESVGAMAQEMGSEGMLQGGAQALGGAVGGTLKLLGRGLYRAGALPVTEMFNKYGDVVRKGVEARVPVSKGGLAKAGRLKTQAQAEKAKALTAADERGMLRTKQIAKDATAQLGSGNRDLLEAGLPGQAQQIVKRETRFLQNNPEGITPTKADQIKGTLDNRLGDAYRKLKKRAPLTPTEEQNMAYAHSLSRGVEDVTPGYRGLNKNVMDTAGLERVIGRRIGPGANQGLENALTMAVGPAALPARLLMVPQVASSAGIGLHEAGKAAPFTISNAARALLMSMLAQEE